MEFIDEEGRLFGRVNVIDAGVVLLLLAVLVSGIALVVADPLAQDTDSTSQSTETRYVTINLGPQPAAVADRITAGDTVTISERHSLLVTDVYRTPAANDRVTTTLRARINGTPLGDTADPAGGIAAGDTAVRLGAEMEVTTNEYSTAGTVTSIDRSGADLATESVPVVLETVQSVHVADTIALGDRVRVGGQTVGRIVTRRSHPTSSPDERRLLIGVDYTALNESGTLTYGGTPLQVGRTASLRTDAYNVTGRILRRGSHDPSGTPTTVTAVVTLRSVNPHLADDMESGMTEASGEETTARVLDADVRPAAVAVTNDDGRLVEREHPRLKDADLTVELAARRTDTGLRFRARPLQEHRSITLDLGTLTVNGTITDLRTE